MGDDIRRLIARLINATGAEGELRAAADADAALGIAARRKGGEAVFWYELYRTMVARADVRSGQIKAVLDIGRAAAGAAAGPGPAPVGPLYTR